MTGSSTPRPPEVLARSATGSWLFDGPPDARPDAPPSRSDPGGDLPAAVLFDRDGTLVVDVPYNGDPARVEPMPSAREAVEAVRALGIPVGVVSNQSGVARGMLTYRQVEAVRRRVEDLLGPFAVWAVCPHGPDDGCGCRKPAPGLILAACERLGVSAERTTVIGDIGADMAAARAAGARGVLVPTPITRPEEIETADTTAPDLLAAVRLVQSAGSDGPESVRRPETVPERPRPVDDAEDVNPARRAAGGPESGHGGDGVRRAEALPGRPGSVDRAEGAFLAGRAAGGSESGRGVGGVRRAEALPGRPGSVDRA
ncbi:D-glycero-alpha-D-manno-heptose-1,7-bisphosphate 7-phosphatase, partial [Streptomyces scabichelini]|uniref:D-glycero-alpha-D-manno-heptose-1,7-bisphosphate 7-phosphatase n=1 Tax=Streptomyces scabichelini TaxID=2711217 RepID=UPI003B96FE8E